MNSNKSNSGCGCLFIFALIVGLFSTEVGGEFMIIIFLLILATLVYAVISSKKEKTKKETLLKNIKEKNKERYDVFSSDKKIDSLNIDIKNELFKLDNEPEIFGFNELQEVRMYQDNLTVHSGTSGTAINLGGVLIGGTNESSSTDTIQKIDIVLITDGINSGRYTYKLLNNPINKNSEDYRLVIEQAEHIINALEKIKNNY